MDLGISLEELNKKSTEEILAFLQTSKSGLTEAEAKIRQADFGFNVFEAKKKVQPLVAFIRKFNNPILLLLIVAAITSAFLHSFFSATVIVVMVLGSVIVDFFNTYKSEKAVEKLREQVSITSALWRGGELKERKIREFVPGDVFEVRAGDLIPADSILIEAKDLFVNEAALTGESLPVEKEVESGKRLIWMGTTVVAGTGTAAVCATGTYTKMGDIASQLEKPETLTEFDKNLQDFSYFIFKLSLALVFAVIVINVFILRKEDPFGIFLFGVAIAVGLAPELLPMIVTANLARGAAQMSRHGVIVKKLSAIHNFGSMDVLCTDKTGTLTEDRIELIKYTDGLGNDDEDVLFWGYLGSCYLTGVTGTLDSAIRDFKKLDIHDWQKVDEIPFDFERRRDSVVVAKGKETVMITKGAPEEMLKICSSYGKNEKNLTEELLKKLHAEYDRLSADGFRVLGLAVKKETARTKLYEKKDEEGMTFLGYLAFLDPPKKTVKATLKRMIEHNVAIKIITGDHHLVAEKIARELELPIVGLLVGEEMDALSPAELKTRVETVNLFARVNPEQKERIIRTLRENGHVVGYLGDGVNDALSLKEADVSISVDNAVDVAKESADIILLRKGLGEIIEGVVEGRKTFANIFKYLMMALSSNFGNMVSMPLSSFFLPFLPMTAPQIILNNFLYDTSQFAIPFDEVSKEFLQKAKKFNLAFMKKFMLIFGPLSSLFDGLTFLVLFFVFRFTGGAFQTGWFLESIATQTLVVNVIRSRSATTNTKPNRVLLISSFGITALAWFAPFTPLGRIFGLVTPPLQLFAFLVAIVVAYLVSVEITKGWFYARWGSLIEK